ncbi:DUF1513 domain-containing protein [Pelagovum pacificum]|uniref:DUF1513 domain-containing protein n=1 Tax=Pelagovum pacificum TaxID=2588711 RepID=A0A5C5GEC5_9RHOB|nr:DUF1513 domain-containing protein [Pelagovum pacificum]QQA43807.1 DUF1513 domain-containing protein [Pelagovum pacificum]TNY33063.1 DUF1513 domain-containing protein [Pelagovum pacificum]
MTTRRGFLAGLAAAASFPRPTWADAGSPAYLAAAQVPDGSYRLFGLTAAGERLFDLPLPDRGHAAAAHPTRPEAVAFARRPGTFALVIDCATGTEKARLESPEGRHFYGHGAFSSDGHTLFTPENDYEAGQGVIGVWDTRADYTRIDEFPSGGVGPHDARLMPDHETLVVANGGIDTHPDSGRTKLNIPLMEPNLTYVTLDGRILEQVELDRALHKNSIRHLAVSPDGQVAFAMQWQGDVADNPPLVGLHRRGEAARLLIAPDEAHRRMEGYAGSVALSGGVVAITSPRGGLAQRFDAETGAFLGQHASADVCGVSAAGTGFALTTGTGLVEGIDADRTAWQARHDCRWDNHLVAI